jgi:hypothetical protein
MPQTSMTRCTMGAALMSAVVGGIAYGSAKSDCERSQEKFRELALDECLANDPGEIMNKPVESADDQIRITRRLTTLHAICAFGMEIRKQ